MGNMDRKGNVEPRIGRGIRPANPSDLGRFLKGSTTMPLPRISGFSQHIEIASLTCMDCGVRFGIDADYLESLRSHNGGCDRQDDPKDDGDEGEGWYSCPNGHVQRYVKSDKQVLGEKFAEMKHAIEHHEATIDTLRRKLKCAVAARDRYKKLAARNQPVKRDERTPVVSARVGRERLRQGKKR